MPATIQKILKPIKYRAIDTSTSRQIISQNLILNGTFAAWSGDDPDNWTVATESGSDPMVTESSGKARLYHSSGGDIRIQQDVLTIGKQYYYSFDITASSAGNLRLESGSGVAYASGISSVATHTGYFTADHAQFRIRRGTASTGTDITIDNVEVYEVESFSNNNHGQIYSGRALEFDGVSDRFATTGGGTYNTPSTDISGVNYFADGNPWTMAVWLYTNGRQDSYIIGKDQGTRPHLYLNVESSVQYLEFRANDAGNDFYRFGRLQENAWHRLVVISNGTTISAYSNGVLIGTITDGMASIDSSGSFTTTEMWFTGWGTPYESGGDYKHGLDGMMSDAQVWDIEWTESDITFDYLNPESLVLNNSSTLLTKDNLMLWYPMQDGHRSQQSHVLDGATGLGPEILTNSDFSSYTNFDGKQGTSNVNGVNFTDWTVQGETDGANGSGEIKIEPIYNGFRMTTVVAPTTIWHHRIFQTMTLTAGNYYTVRFEVRGNVTSNYTAGIRDGDARPIMHDIGEIAGDKQWVTIEDTFFYNGFTTDGDVYPGFYIQALNSDTLVDGFWSEFRNLSLKQKFRNNATTVFYGDNLYTAANALKVAADGTTDDETNATTGWNDLGTSTFTTSSTSHSGSKSLVYEANVNHGGVSTDLQPYLTVGKTYKLSLFVRHTTGGTAASDQSLRFSDASNLQSNVTEIAQVEPSDITFTEVSREFIYDDDKYRYFGAKELNGDGSSGDGGLFMDTMYIKEVGFATGWTEADQQLDIPQTALQSYNQLYWMNGYNDEYITPSAIEPTQVSHTLSFWFMPTINDLGTSSHGLFECQSYQVANFRLYYDSNGKLVYELSNDEFVMSSGGNKIIQLKSRVIPELTAAGFTGDWMHICVTHSGTGGVGKFDMWINGQRVSEETTSDIDTPLLVSESAYYLANHNTSSSPTVMGLGTAVSWKFGLGSGFTDFPRTGGCFNEMAYFNYTFNQTQARELYNNGKALDAREHSRKDDLFRYWKNEGRRDCTDLSGNNGEKLEIDNSASETLLIPEGVDGRDIHGFLMNRQKDTNTLNLKGDAYVTDGVTSSADVVTVRNFMPFAENGFTYGFWFKVHDISGRFLSGIGDTGNSRRMYIGQHGIGSKRIIFGCGSNYQSTTEDFIEEDEWIHVIMTYDGTTNKTYVNGKYKHSVVRDYVGVSADYFTVGGIASTPVTANQTVTYNTKGMIDDVLIYDRPLTNGGVSIDEEAKGEIGRIYNAGKRSHK